MHLVCCRFMSSIWEQMSDHETAQQCRYICSTWEWFPILQQYYTCNDKQEIKILKCTTHTTVCISTYSKKEQTQINTIIHTKILSQCCSFLIDYMCMGPCYREKTELQTCTLTHAWKDNRTKGLSSITPTIAREKNLDLLQ